MAGHSEKICQGSGEARAGTVAHLSRARYQPLWLLLAYADSVSDFVRTHPGHYLCHRFHTIELAEALTQLIWVSKRGRIGASQQPIPVDGSGPSGTDNHPGNWHPGVGANCGAYHVH